MQLTPIASNMTEVETSEARILFSYRTPVAAYVFGEGFVRTEKWWSVTTSTTHQQMVRWWDSKRSVTNLPRQVGLGGYNKTMAYKPDLPMKQVCWLYIIVFILFLL